MKDYLVHADDHRIEVFCRTLTEAKREAAKIYKDGIIGRNDVVIDEYDDHELTDVYWIYYKGKIIKVG